MATATKKITVGASVKGSETYRVGLAGSASVTREHLAAADGEALATITGDLATKLTTGNFKAFAEGADSVVIVDLTGTALTVTPTVIAAGSLARSDAGARRVDIGATLVNDETYRITGDVTASRIMATGQTVTTIADDLAGQLTTGTYHAFRDGNGIIVINKAASSLSMASFSLA